MPALVACIPFARRGSLAFRLAWSSLLVYLAYTYATYAFDRLYTPLFPLYMLIFGASSFAVAATLGGIDLHQAADHFANLRFRSATAIYLAFTGLILYAIELPIILSRIPGGANLTTYDALVDAEVEGEAVERTRGCLADRRVPDAAQQPRRYLSN